MSERQTVECKTHGAVSPPTFACVHVASGTGAGLVYDDDSREAYPDLLCEACASDPEWSDEVALERIKLLCPRCWEKCFARNTTVAVHPHPEQWIAAARERAAERQDAWATRFDIGKHGHYEYRLDVDAPWIGFGADKSSIAIRGDAFVIGSFSKISNTWLWGWANDHWQATLTEPIVALKRFGEANGLEPLWHATFDADEDQCFGLASTVLDVLPEFEGIYRSPGERTSLFIAVKNTHLVQ
jgi:hypothetical protein